MSDELSKEAKAKLSALVPHPAQTDQEARPNQTSASTLSSASSTQRNELEKANRRPPGYVTDMSAMEREKEKLRAAIASLTDDIRSMTERLRANDQELQKLRKIVEEQEVKLHDQEQSQTENRRTIEDLKVSMMKSMTTQARLCQNCQRALDSTDRFCYGCGYPTFPVRPPQDVSQNET